MKEIGERQEENATHTRGLSSLLLHAITLIYFKSSQMSHKRVELLLCN